MLQVQKICIADLVITIETRLQIFAALAAYQTMFCVIFSSRRRHTILVSDWSSDVCSSDLGQDDRVYRASSSAPRLLLRTRLSSLSVSVRRHMLALHPGRNGSTMPWTGAMSLPTATIRRRPRRHSPCATT